MYTVMLNSTPEPVVRNGSGNFYYPGLDLLQENRIDEDDCSRYEFYVLTRFDRYIQTTYTPLQYDFLSYNFSEYYIFEGLEDVFTIYIDLGSGNTSWTGYKFVRNPDVGVYSSTTSSPSSTEKVYSLERTPTLIVPPG